MINFRPIARVISILFGIIGLMIWTALPFSWFYAEDGWPIFLAGLTSMGMGGICSLLYVGLTGTLGILLVAFGLSPYEAINHALTTMATGGFSTRNASAAAFPPHVQYLLIVFMFLAGVNYTVLYLSWKRRWADVWRSDELKAYIGLVVILCCICTTGVYFSANGGGLEQSFRDSLFRNVGPGIGKVGPVDNFAWLSPQIKVFLSFMMVIGRLEIYTVLVLFSPFFWRLN